MKAPLSICLLILYSLPLVSSAIEKAYPRTHPGDVEIKWLPAARVIASHSEADYFEADNGLFRPLFRYISARDIPMTAPVEAEITPGTMYFYIGAEIRNSTLEATDTVSVHQLPKRQVASIGVRGSYSEANFNEAAEKLTAWLSTNNEYSATGAPRGIFWNGPYVPGIFKKFEVHIPIEPQTTK